MAGKTLKDAQKAVAGIIKFHNDVTENASAKTDGEIVGHLNDLKEAYKDPKLAIVINGMFNNKTVDELKAISEVLEGQKKSADKFYVYKASGWLSAYEGAQLQDAVNKVQAKKVAKEVAEMEKGDNPGSVGVASSSVVRESDDNKPKVVEQTAVEKEAAEKEAIRRSNADNKPKAAKKVEIQPLETIEEKISIKDMDPYMVTHILINKLSEDSEKNKDEIKSLRNNLQDKSLDAKTQERVLGFSRARLEDLGVEEVTEEEFNRVNNLLEGKRKLRGIIKEAANQSINKGDFGSAAVEATKKEAILVKEFNKLVIDNDVKGLERLVKNNPDFTVLNKTMAGKSYEKESVKEAMNQGPLSSEMNQFLNSMKLRDRIALGTLDSRDLVANLEAVAGSREIGDNKGKEYPAFDMPLPGVNKTALHYAAEKGRFELVDDMIDLGAKKDTKILAALVVSGDEKGVRKLLNRKFKTSGSEFKDIPTIDYSTKQEYKGAERLIAVMNTPIHELNLEDQNIQRDIQASQFRHTGTAEFRRATRDMAYATADAGRAVGEFSRDVGSSIASGATSAYNKLPTKEAVGKGALTFVSTPFLVAGAGMVMFYDKALKPMGSYTFKKGAIGVENARWAGSRAKLMASNISEDMSRKVTRGKENFSAMQEYREFGRSADSAAVEGKQLNDKLTVLGSKLNSKEERDQFNEAMVSYDQNEKALINLSKNLKKNRGEMSAEQMEHHKEEFAKATKAMGEANLKFSGILNEASKTNPSLKADIGKLNEATKKFETKLDALEVKALDFDKRLNDRNSQDKITQEARDIKASNLWNESKDRADEYRDVNAQSLAAGEALADLPGRENRPEFVKGNKVAEIDRNNLSPVDEEVIDDVVQRKAAVEKVQMDMIEPSAKEATSRALGQGVKPTKNPKMVGFGGDSVQPLKEALDRTKIGPDVDIETNIDQRKVAVKEAEQEMRRQGPSSSAVISNEGTLVSSSIIDKAKKAAVTIQNTRKFNREMESNPDLKRAVDDIGLGGSEKVKLDLRSFEAGDKPRPDSSPIKKPNSGKGKGGRGV